MKINYLKALIAFVISILLGLLCYSFATGEDSRNLISLAVASITIFLCLLFAFAMKYNCGHRDVNIKVSAWVFSIIVIITNFIFAFTLYNIIVYIAVTFALTVIGIAIVATLYKPQK